jgi:hypothetical protein
MTEQGTQKFLDLIEDIKTQPWEFPALRPFVVAQMVLECGRGSTDLFKLHSNPMGQHYHDFMKEYATGVEYNACDGVGMYAKFSSFENVTRSYFAWFDYWDHYGDWRSAAKKGGEAFLLHIGPHYCPPGFTKEWAASHGGLNYAQYICQKLLPEAKELLGDMGTPMKEATWLNIANDKSCVQAMNGGDLIETFEGNSLRALMSAVASHPKMGTWAVGERKKGDVTNPVKDDPNVDYLPFARIASKKMKEVANGYPEYFVIHWTAGEPSQSGEDGISAGVANGYTYAFLPRDGQLWQGAPIHDGGYHAGNAKISSLKAFGIEVACAGRLEKIGDLFVPWFAKNKDGSVNKGRCISASQVRYDNDGPADDGSFEGYYQVYTAEQVKTLVAIALWFVQVRKMPIDNIVGHDEVATPYGRKCDPGFSILEGGMVAFRALIKKHVSEGKSWRDFI